LLSESIRTANELAGLASGLERLAWSAYLRGGTSNDYIAASTNLVDPKYLEASRIRDKGYKAFYACKAFIKKSAGAGLDETGGRNSAQAQFKGAPPAEIGELEHLFRDARVEAKDIPKILQMPLEAARSFYERAINATGNDLFAMFLRTSGLPPSQVAKLPPGTAPVYDFVQSELDHGLTSNPAAKLIAGQVFQRLRQLEGTVLGQMSVIDSAMSEINRSEPRGGSPSQLSLPSRMPPGRASSDSNSESGSILGCGDIGTSAAMDLAVENPPAYEELLRRCRR
jgi:hypothetical protein